MRQRKRLRLRESSKEVRRSNQNARSKEPKERKKSVDILWFALIVSVLTKPPPDASAQIRRKMGTDTVLQHEVLRGGPAALTRRLHPWKNRGSSKAGGWFGLACMEILPLWSRRASPRWPPSCTTSLSLAVVTCPCPRSGSS